MIGYKIFDVDDCGTFRFLFHGLNKTRIVSRNKWLKANKILGKDGSGKTHYITGFHFFKTQEEAENWPGDMTDREIVKVSVRGIREKTHSRWDTFLADEMKVGKNEEK